MVLTRHLLLACCHAIQAELIDVTPGALRREITSMPFYRLFFFNANGGLTRRLDLDCRDDQHAIEAVAEHNKGAYMELWHRDKLIKSFGVKPEKN